jgi:hypothetical protein
VTYANVSKKIAACYLVQSHVFFRCSYTILSKPYVYEAEHLFNGLFVFAIF